MTVNVEIPRAAAVFGVLDPLVKQGPGGELLISARQPLPDYADSYTERLKHWARATPDQVFLAQRDAKGGWRRITYGQTLDLVRRIAAGLLARGLSRERPVLILSGNDIEQALLSLAGMEVGVPTCPLSTAYSLISQDYGKLRYALDLLTPGMVYATSGQMFARAIKAAVPAGMEVVIGDDGAAAPGATSFASLCETAVTSAVDRANAAISRDDIAKFLLTSGSTGQPKAVINTHRMLCANQVMIREAVVGLKHEPPVLVDWLPWAHTFGSNHNFGIALYNGGTLYIDEGKPMPGAVEATVRNLREIAPTVYFNVPKGFEALLPYLQQDADLRKTFFSRLGLLFYAGAGLAKPIWDAYRDLARETTGRAIPFTTSLGSTETAPAALFNTIEGDRPGVVGLPMVGVELKLVPNAGKMEARLRGPNIMPGYWRSPELTGKAFDDDGFYRLGDALKPADPNDWSKGLLFDGRVSEDFKLATGTWVSVGPLRGLFIEHCSPLVRDVVIAGHDRDDIAVIVFPDVEACRALAGGDAALSTDQILGHPAVRARFESLLATLAAASTGSSTRVARAILTGELPSIDLGEVTDKGSLNQRAVLTHRAALVDDLYAPAPSSKVIVTPKK